MTNPAKAALSRAVNKAIANGASVYENKPVLYGVIVDGVHPRQVVTVTDDYDRAQALSAHLNKTVRNVTTCEAVDSFYPAGMCDADETWLKVAREWQQQNKR